MRDYGLIPTNFWRELAPKLSDRARVIYLYLHTCDHTTLIGSFRIPLGYIAADLGYGIETVSEPLAELSRNQLLTYHQPSAYGYLHYYLIPSPLANPNMEKAAVKAFKTIPDAVPFKLDFARLLLQNMKSESRVEVEGFLNAFVTVSEPFQNPIETCNSNSNSNKTPIVPLPGDDPPEKKFKATTPDPDPPPTPPAEKKPESNTEAIGRIFAHWQAVMHHPQAKLDRVRRNAIANAFKLGYTERQCLDAIDGCKATPWNMGLDPGNKTVYDSLKLILRNADQIERFIANKFNPPPLDPSVIANNAAAKKIASRKECVACEIDFDPAADYKPVGTWDVCEACRPEVEAKYKRREQEAHYRHWEKLGGVKIDGKWYTPEQAARMQDGR